MEPYNDDNAPETHQSSGSLPEEGAAHLGVAAAGQDTAPTPEPPSATPTFAAWVPPVAPAAPPMPPTPAPLTAPSAYPPVGTRKSYAKAGRRHKKGRPLVAAGIAAGASIGLIAAGVLGGVIGHTLAQDETQPVSSGATVITTTTQDEAVADTTNPVLPSGASIADIAENSRASIVQLNVSNAEGEGTGSGFFTTNDGYIITNDHVAGGGGDIEVVLFDGTKLVGKLVGTEGGYDLAVVKVDYASQPLILGQTEGIRVGDPVIAMGSPLGLQGTVTTGIVSSLNRPVTAGEVDSEDISFINAIQTDAAINPGNSGGPLLNEDGNVIGVNSAIATVSSIKGEAGNIGVGFAIPVDVVQRVTTSIIEGKEVPTPIIGVKLDNTYTGDGARVENVEPSSPADLAGLQAGDVITHIDGMVVSDGVSLVVSIRSKAPGDRVVITVTRGGSPRDYTLNLGTDNNE